MTVNAAVAAESRNSVAKAVGLWASAGLFAFVFVLAGMAKFANPELAQHVVRWGYPDWARILIAVIQIGGGAMLLLPRTAPYATGALAAVLSAAILTHLRYGVPLHAAVPLVLLVLLMLLAYGRRLQTVTPALLGSRRSRLARRGTSVAVLNCELSERIPALQRECVDAFFSIAGDAVSALPKVAARHKKTLPRARAQERCSL